MTTAPPQPSIRPPQLPVYTPPTTPEEIAREKDRISLLLEINVVLLQHTTTLQAQGLGGVLGTQQPQQMAGGDGLGEVKNPSEEYVKCMRCLSSNISYLTAAATMIRNRPGTLPGPAIMEPPDSLVGLLEPYERLRALFPGWTGLATAAASSSGNMAAVAAAAGRPGSIGGGVSAIAAQGGMGLGMMHGQAQAQAQGQTMGLPPQQLGMGYQGAMGIGTGIGMGMSTNMGMGIGGQPK